MALYNTKTTYQIILEHIDVFNTLLNESYDMVFDVEKNTSNLNTSKNLFFLDTYTKLLDDYVDSIPSIRNDDINTKKKVSECLSYEHLISKNIIYFGEKIGDRSTFYITKHLLEIIKDIYKDKLVPLSKSEYNDFNLLLINYVSFFKETIYNKNSKEINEKKVSLENLLSEINAKILSSISSLENISMNTFTNVDYNDLKDLNSTKHKLNQARKLQDLHISPLYKFTNRKNSEFMMNLDLLRNLFNSQNKHFDLLKTIDHYYLQFLFVSKKTKPIREYIISFVKQNEISLHRNLGNEKMFNELAYFIEEKFIGKHRNTKIWSSENEKLKNIINFFQNSARSVKSSGIKENKINEYFLTRVSQHMNEEMDVFNLNKEVKLLINNEYNKIMKNKLLENKRRKLNKTISSKFLQYSNNKKIEDKKSIVEYVLGFLNGNDEIKEEWNIGHLQSLVRNFVKTNYESVELTDNELSIERMDRKTKYKDIIWSKTND